VEELEMQRDVVPSGVTLVVVLVGALFGARGCSHEQQVGHEGVLVGGPCLGNGDCSDLCLEGGRYPDGTCSTECENDDDCPDGTWCIDLDGGVCLLACSDDSGCRPAYECDSRDRKGTPGDVLACRDG
jgi:hypothetical protein